MTYGALATELAIESPRTLNYPLAAIGYELSRLSQRWGKPIPPIQMLVHNAISGVPGHGVYGFVGEDGSKLNLRQKRLLVQEASHEIFAFPEWNQVLSELGLQPAPTCLDPAALANMPIPHGGESVPHRTLKEVVAKHPEVVRLPRTGHGTIEYRLASADSVDVVFKTRDLHLAVEVKAEGAPTLDIARGLFQCIKYQAVLAAMNAYASLAVECRAILVLGGDLPSDLLPLRNALGVDVVERVKPR